MCVHDYLSVKVLDERRLWSSFLKMEQKWTPRMMVGEGEIDI